MTIPLSTKSYDHYAGTNALKVYPITFPTYEASTLQVYVTNLADWSHIAGEVLSGLKVFDLVIDTDFTFANLARPNTTITLKDASAVPPGWVGPIPARQEWLDTNGFLRTGYYLFVEFVSNAMRPSVLASGNNLVPALSKDLDRLAMHIKALDHKVYEGFKDLIQMSAGSGASGLLPNGTAPGEYLEFDGADAIWQSGEYKGYSQRLGQLVDAKSNREAILTLFNFIYTPPTISLSCSPAQTLREKGTVISAVTMTATTVKVLNDITSVTHFRSAVLVDTEASPLANGGIETYVNSTPFSDNMSFYSRVGDGTGTNQSNTVNYPFVYPTFWNAGAQDLAVAAIGGKQIVNNSNSRNVTYSGLTGQVFYYAFPASYGNLTKITDENGFDVTGSFTKKTKNYTALDAAVVSYTIYELTTPLGINLNTNFTFIR